MNVDWQPLWLSVRLAGITTLILALIGIPMAYRLARSRHRFKPLLEALISLPLVLPPTVLGFYLLRIFNPAGALGSVLDQYLHLRFVFTFEGLVMGSCLFSLPFMMQSLQTGFQAIPPQYREAALCLGKSEWTILTRVMLPNIRPALLAGCVLSFCHTLGEFGVVLMMGGNLPGVTRVASMALYDQVESLQYAEAHWYAAILALFSFSVLGVVYWVHRHRRSLP